MNVENGCPLVTPEKPNGWVEASATMLRWREVFAAAYKEAEDWHLTAEQRNDYAQVTAWLDKYAQMRHLRVVRTIAGKYKEYAQHKVSILEDLETIECGGYASMSELHRCGDAYLLFEKETLGNGWIRVELMITDQFPTHEMFQRADGSRIDLGFNDDDHYHVFAVSMHEDDLTDIL
jgi:hypothetical protein